jgi:hypothetical protein
MQLLAESPNRRTERLRQLAQCGLEREAYWAQEGAQGFPPGRRDAERTAPVRIRPTALLMNVPQNEDPVHAALTGGDSRFRSAGTHVADARWHPAPTGTLFSSSRRVRAETED